MTELSDGAMGRLRSAANWPHFQAGRYSVVRALGRGGMGTVYLGRDHDLSRDVAIKVTNGIDAGGDLEVRMRAEARVLADLEHPGIVPIHDVGTLADGRMFTVMKLVRGATLAEYLATPRSLAERLQIFERLCEPVAFAHARGTVHRDLKPANVMIGAFGEVLVLDWGLATRAGQGDKRDKGDRRDEGGFAGTQGFMAPEQAAGGVVDARADVHALGVILREMLSAERATPKRLRAIAAKATAPRAVDRYADAGGLSRDLVRFRSGLPVEACPETVLDRAARLAVTYRTPILLILSYLVVRAIIAVVFRR